MAGKVTFGGGQIIGHGSVEARQVLDDLAHSLGLFPLGPSWLEVDLAHATTILRTAMCTQLAYASAIPNANPAPALQLLLTRTPRAARYFTNTDMDPQGTIPLGGWGFSSLTQATFDCGVAVVGGDTARVIVIEDED